jgi:hypothetical protein
MTGNTWFDLTDKINLDDYFVNPYEDVRLAYNFNFPSEVADVVLNMNKITSITTHDVYGDFVLTAVASNYYGSAEYDFIVLVDPRISLMTDEDVVLWYEMDAYVPSNVDSYELKTTQGISSDMNLMYNESPFLSITPDLNWFGTGNVQLEIFDSPYSIPIPPLSGQEQMNLEDDLSSWLFGCFELDVAVNAVNDPPSSEGTLPIHLTITSDSQYDLIETIDLGSLFFDVDSEMSYSWVSQNGFAAIDMVGSSIEGFSSKNVNENDVLRLVAYDGEFAATYDISVNIVAKPYMGMEEDIVSTMYIDDYLDTQIQEYSMNSNGYVASEITYDENGVPVATLTPYRDWNGVDAIGLSVYPITSSINPPYSPETINSAPPDPTNPPIPYIEYAYYEFIVDVSPINDPPYAIQCAPVNMFEDMSISNAFNLADCFGDVDSTLIYTLGMTPASRLDVEFTYEGSVNIAADENWFGTQFVWIMATDGEFTTSQDVSVTVSPVNDIPFASDAAEIIVFDEDNAISINLADYIADVDDALWYSFVTNDANTTMELDENTWNLNITPDENWNGIVQMTLFGADNEFQIARNLTLEVTPVNDMPVVISTPDIIFLEGGYAHLDLASMFMDVDSELQFYVYSTSGKLVCQSTRASELTLAPTSPLWNGNDVLRIVATDGEYVISQDLDVTVLPVNDAPTLNACQDGITIMEDSEFSMSLIGMFADPDGDELQYNILTGDNINTDFDAETMVLKIWPDSDWNGVSSVRVNAWDDTFLVWRDLSVTVTEVNDMPYQLAAIPSVILASGNSTTIYLQSYFEDVETANLNIEILGGDNVTVSKLDTTGFFDIQAADSWEGTETLTVRVTDGQNVLETSIAVSAYKEKIVIETASSDVSFLQSMSWMGVGMVVAIAAFAMYSTTKDQNVRPKINKGRVL